MRRTLLAAVLATALTGASTLPASAHHDHIAREVGDGGNDLILTAEGETDPFRCTVGFAVHGGDAYDVGLLSAGHCYEDLVAEYGSVTGTWVSPQRMHSESRPSTVYGYGQRTALSLHA